MEEEDKEMIKEGKEREGKGREGEKRKKRGKE